jgi:hypothetical protein
MKGLSEAQRQSLSEHFLDSRIRLPHASWHCIVAPGSWAIASGKGTAATVVARAAMAMKVLEKTIFRYIKF